MKTGSLVLRVMAVVAMLFTGLAGGASVSAQDQKFEPNAYTSELSGYDIKVSGNDFEISNAKLQHFHNGEGEVVELEGDAVYLEISFFDDRDTPEDSIEAYLRNIEDGTTEFNIIDSGNIGNTYYSLVSIVYNDTDLVYYVQVTEDVVGNVDLFESILVLTDWVEHDLTLAQESVTIDGNPFMQNVDPAAIANSVETGEPIHADVAESTPEADESGYTFTIVPVELQMDPAYVMDGAPEIGSTSESVYYDGPNVVSMVRIVKAEDTERDEVYSDLVEEMMTGAPEGAVELASHSDAATTWTLYFGTKDDGEDRTVLIYMRSGLVPGHLVLEAHGIKTADVAGEIEALQQGVTLDGEGVLHGIDANTIQSLVDGEEVSDLTGDDDKVESSDLENPRDGAKIGSDTTSGDDTDESTPEAGSEFPGELTDSSWTGEAQNVEISWNSSMWSVDWESEQPLISELDNDRDQVKLIRQDDGPPSFVAIDVIASDGYTPADFLEYWLGSSYTDRDLNENHELLLSRSRGDGAAVVYKDSTDSGVEYLLVREAYQLDDDTLILVMYFALPSEMASGYADMRESFQADGVNFVTVFTDTQLERALED